MSELKSRPCTLIENSQKKREIYLGNTFKSVYLPWQLRECKLNCMGKDNEASILHKKIKATKGFKRNYFLFPKSYTTTDYPIPNSQS